MSERQGKRRKSGRPGASSGQRPGESLSDYQKRILRDIPQLPQRQDATNDQLRDLRVVANRLGMYDAADLVRTMLEDSPGGI